MKTMPLHAHHVNGTRQCPECPREPTKRGRSFDEGRYGSWRASDNVLRLLIGACFLFAGACAFDSGSLDRKQAKAVPTSQAAAGSVHVTVLSAAPWNEYVGLLQPGFTLTAEDARDLVIPTTRSTERRSVDRVSGSASVGIKTEAPERVGADEDQGMADARRTRGWQTRPIGAGAQILPFLEPLAVGDPITRFAAATALYQEVQILNRYLSDAAIPPGYEAYVMRLQITLLPKSRGAPLDAYSTIAFFNASEGDDVDAIDSKGGFEEEEAEAQESVADRAPRGPIVLPLLVTDNLESGDVFDSARRIRAMAVAAGYATTGFGITAGAESVQQDSEQTEGSDLNSLMTVARVSPNTLRVRLGAMQQGSTPLAMVPRSHNVTLLVMVPSGESEHAWNRVKLVARTVFTHAATGEELDRRTDAEQEELCAQLAAQYRMGPDGARLIGQELLPLAQLNRTGEFFDRLDGAYPDESDNPARRFASSLWLEVVSLFVGGQFSADIVDLRPVSPTAYFDEGETRSLLLDTGTLAVATVEGGVALDPWRIRAKLLLRSDAGTTSLTPDAIELLDGGRAIRLRFPSLSGLIEEGATLEVVLDYASVDGALAVNRVQRGLTYRPVPGSSK